MTEAATQAPIALPPIARFQISPLIRITLLLLYVALTVPLPFLAQATAAPVSPTLMAVGLGVGAIALYAALSEQVILTETGIQVAYPVWVRWLLRRGWSLAWEQIASLKPRSTGQGGLVYYFVDRAGQGYLLPMRVAGFGRLVTIVQARTDLDMADIKPLAQPWMYLILLGLTVILLLIDAWVLGVALTT